MTSYDHDAVIVALASRASDQVKSGIKELHAGNLLAAEVFLNAAAASLNSLVVLLETPEPVKPFRKLAVVGSELPSWMNRKANSEDPDAA